ncbi:MAG: glycosyltransferase [Acidobacteria bacterium]|nr:glycosyltransferase [Acidobacteriota bacterium]
MSHPHSNHSEGASPAAAATHAPSGRDGVSRESVAPPFKISVAVPARNEERSIVRLLEALAGQTEPPAEIVIADGGSTDRTRELVRAFSGSSPVPIVLVETERGLPGRNRNLAIARASNEWVACVDAGTAPRREWLEELTGAARRDDSARVVWGSFEAVNEGLFTECAAIAYVPPPHEAVRSIASCLLHRSAWESAGGFREDLRSGEDLLFFRALDAAGVRSTRAPAALVAWELAPTTASTFGKFTTYSRHNIRAGLAREWQYSVTRLYLLLFALLAAGVFIFRPLIVLPPLLLLVRSARRLWKWHAAKPAARRLLALANPPRLLVVTWINLVIDAAMFRGMWQWLRHDRKGRNDER